MYLICRPLYGLSYSWWSGDGVLVGAWCTVTKGGGVGWGRDIDQNLPWHQPLHPSYSIRPPCSTLLSISPSLSLSLSLYVCVSLVLYHSLSISPFSLSLALLVSTLPYPHLPSFLTPSLHSTERSQRFSMQHSKRVRGSHTSGKRIVLSIFQREEGSCRAQRRGRSTERDYVD